MRRNISIRLSCFLILVHTASFGSTGQVPQAIENIARKHTEPVQEYVYKSKTVYLTDSRHLCCDQGAELYDESGNIMCRFIGIAGLWEKQCKDFDDNSVFIRVITIKD